MLWWYTIGSDKGECLVPLKRLNPLQLFADELFKIKFVKKGSLIMLTTIAASVLGDPEAFEAAVMSFLTKMIEDCEFKTEIPDRVDVWLHILNANEVSISCELPLEVRHAQATGIKKELAESVINDVAFFEWRRQKRNSMGAESVDKAENKT